MATQAGAAIGDGPDAIIYLGGHTAPTRDATASPLAVPVATRVHASAAYALRAVRRGRPPRKNENTVTRIR